MSLLAKLPKLAHALHKVHHDHVMLGTAGGRTRHHDAVSQERLRGFWGFSVEGYLCQNADSFLSKQFVGKTWF